MAISKTRTNYFSVTDADRFKEIIGLCKGAGEIEINENKNGKFGFMCDGSILGFPDGGENFICYNCDHAWFAPEESESEKYPETCPECSSEDIAELEWYGIDYSFDKFCEALQTVLPDNEVIIITEIGSEEMCCLTGHSTVITNKLTKFVDLEAESLNAARELLSLPDYETQM